MRRTIKLSCACKRVRLEVSGGPIVSAQCRCASCNMASAMIERRPGAPQLLHDGCGTDYVLYRKDRVRVAAGAELLREFRLQPDSPTRRVIASCCNTPLFLDFEKDHWLSLYGVTWAPDERPEVQMQAMTAPFFLRLLIAWVGMGFRSSSGPAASGVVDV